MLYLLKLYITGHTPASVRAVDNLKRICEIELEGKYELRIIDILKEPGEAEKDKIVATPTLIKELPPPIRTIVGDLANKEDVLFELELLKQNDDT